MGSDNILRCPFCDRPLIAPEEIMTKFGNIISGGRCECSAAFVYDGTGHNIGDAYVDALTLVCDGDMDKAWSMTPEVDYEVKELSYNIRKNRFGREAVGRARRTPVYLFVRLKQGAGKDG
jgi:hypothetical protein